MNTKKHGFAGSVLKRNGAVVMKEADFAPGTRFFADEREPVSISPGFANSKSTALTALPSGSPFSSTAFETVSGFQKMEKPAGNWVASLSENRRNVTQQADFDSKL